MSAAENQIRILGAVIDLKEQCIKSCASNG